MFGQYFGDYLVEKNKISQAQLEDLITQQEGLRAKLGTIAVAEKLLTKKQAEEVNKLQKQMDRRFGDIAVEKGYLVEEEVNHLLNLQGNPYLKFVQALTEHGILSLEEIEDYLRLYKKEKGFSDLDLEALKSGDIDRIASVFVDTNVPFSGECIRLVLRNLVRFISTNIKVENSYKTKKYSFGTLACQQMVGDEQIFVGFAGKDKELLEIANAFAKEIFPTVNEDAFDSVCEFINCSNGLYASKVSHENIHIDMTPPLFYSNNTITSPEDIIVVPVFINGKQSDLIVIMNYNVEIN